MNIIELLRIEINTILANRIDTVAAGMKTEADYRGFVGQIAALREVLRVMKDIEKRYLDQDED